MTKERINELERLAADAIQDSLLYGQADNPALEFWKGVKAVVDELKVGHGISHDCGEFTSTPSL